MALLVARHPYLNTEGFNLVVYPRGPAWHVQVTNRKTGRRQTGTLVYPSLVAAQDAALDALLWAKDHLK